MKRKDAQRLAQLRDCKCKVEKKRDGEGEPKEIKENEEKGDLPTGNRSS